MHTVLPLGFFTTFKCVQTWT